MNDFDFTDFFFTTLICFLVTALAVLFIFSQ
jgi:hypothetical protein